MTHSATGPQGPTSHGSSGVPTVQPPVRIDRDVEPVWETEVLPDWVTNWLIPMLSAGQKWPEASESGMSKLAHAYHALAAGAIATAPRAGSAVRTVATGWSSPASADFVSRAKYLYGHGAGMAGTAGKSQDYLGQSENFAVETQYSKLSVNVAFWVTVVAIAIALFVAFFSAGASTAIIGPYAAAGRAAISRILVRLAMIGAREVGAGKLARVTALSGATGRGLIARLLGSAIGKELVEEIGEEFFIDAAAQYQQIQMGTRKEWDWKKSQAAIIGAGGGALAGTALSGPISRLTRHMPGFPGRAMTTGLTNTIASPVGSFFANGLVYGQWDNPFTTDSILGGFMGGAGRTGSISPFNPEVYTTLANPVTALASAYDSAARTDAARAGGGDPSAGVGNPPAGGPAPSGGGPVVSTGAAPSSSQNDDVRRGTPATSAPDSDAGPRRGSTSRDDRQNTDREPRAETNEDSTDDTADDTAANTDTTPQTPDPKAKSSSAPAPQTAAPQTQDDSQDDSRSQDDSQDTRQDAQQDDQRRPAPRQDAQPAPAAQQDAQPDTQQNPQQDAQPDAQPDAQQDNQQNTQQNPQQDNRQGPTAQQGDQQQAAAPQNDDTPATTSAAAPDDAPPPTPVLATVRARNALMNSLAVDFPGAVVGPNGDLLIPYPDGTVRVIRAATMRRVRAALDTRADEVTDADELQAEATALVLLAQETGETRQPATSRPGTVTSRPVPGTRHVPDARPGTSLQPDEVEAGADALRTSHFLNQDVEDITWSADGTLVVRTRNNGTHHFRPVIGEMTEGLMGETELSTGEDAQNAHVVHFAPGMNPSQVSRVWLHEITDTLQKLQEDTAPERRGFLRRKPATSEPTQDMCAQAQLNELAFLAEQWQAAPTPQEQRLLALDIDGVSRQLSDRGHTPPLPPWAPKPGSRPTHAPPLPQGRPAREELPAVIDALKRAEAAMQEQIDAKRKSAEEAKEAIRKSRQEARKADRQHDQGHAERARKARAESRTHRATRERHTRIADAYEVALREATRTRKTYEQLLTALNEIENPSAPAGPVGMRPVAERLANQVLRQHAAYLDALAAALPQEINLAAAQPTGRLAHVSALTTAVNDLLADNGIGHRFTTHELERAIRADFHKAVSADGLVVQVGQHGKAAEVRIKLTLADLVEVLDPAIKGSEMMVGLFHQAGRTASVTQAGSGGLSMGFDTSVLAQFLPEDTATRMMTELLGVGIGASIGRNWSNGGGAGMFAQTGSVTDNRSESLLFDAAATWTAEIRTGQEENWRGTVTVDSGAPGDSSSQRLWFSHSATDQPPRRLEWIDRAKRRKEMPNVVVQSMSDLEGAVDMLADVLGGDYAEIGTSARDALRGFVTHNLPHSLRTAVNEGLERVFTKNGEPQVRVRAESRVVVELSEPVGGSTSEEWEEEVLVDFVATPASASSGASLEGSASAGFNAPGLAAVDLGGYQPKIGPKANGARGASRSYSATANKQAIHPSVRRMTHPMQSYRLVVVTTFTVERFGEPPVTLTPVRSTALADMREKAAFDFGLPVDSAALVRKNGQPVTDANGVPVLRGDPNPAPPPGRKPELPVWLGEGPGKMRGAGPALVEEIEGLAEFREKVLEELAKRGVIPKVVNGVPEYATNDLARASQILNRQELMEQLSEQRIRAAYDSLAQDGIVLDLTLHGLNAAPEHYMLHLSLQQDFDDVTYVGHTDTQTVVNLDIGSDTSARGISRSRTYSGGASVSESDGPNKGQDGLTHEVGVNGGGNRTRTAGSSAGGTTNIVTLEESSGPVAILKLGHRMTADLLHNGTTTTIATTEGSARLVFAADLLPSTKETPPTPIGRMTPKLRSIAQVLHVDVGRPLDAARQVLPRGTTADSVALQHLMTFLNVRNLVAHPKLLNRPFTTDGAIRPNGGPTRSSLSVSGEIGETEVLGLFDPVTGKIKFGLGSAGISWGGSSGLSAGMSTSASDLDDGGTTSDGGSLSLPSRSGGTSESTSLLDIWGSEELVIKYGRHYMLRSTVDLTLTGSESAEHGVPTGERIPVSGPRTQTVSGTALFAVAEDEALLMYGEGDLDLPLYLVGDAVERFLNGSLALDRSIAVPLVQRYVKDMAQSGVTNEYTERHTPQALLTKLKEVAGLGSPAPGSPQEKLDQALDDAAQQLERSRDVVLAPPYDQSVGASATESLTLTDENGNPVDVIDAVRSAVQDAVPGALEESTTLGEELNVDFSEDAAVIHVTDMWSSRGFERSYHVQQGAQVTQAEEVTVRVRLEPVGDPRTARLLSQTSQAGLIVQHYRYTDQTHSESYNGSYSAGLDSSTGDPAGGQGGGLSTDRGRGYSGSTNHQNTRLQRIGLFNGLTQVEQQMRVVIEVERRPVRGGRIPAGAKKTADRLRRRPRATPPVVYNATLVRRVPTGMTRPAAEDPGPVVRNTDPRQAELHPGFFTQALREDPAKPSLYEVVTAQLTKMLGAAAVQERRPELIRRLAPSALLTAFERMTDPAGEPLVPVSRQKFKDQGATVTVHARTSDLTIVAGPYDGEKGQVDRQADAQNVTVSRGHTTPVGWGVKGSDKSTGVNGGVKGGEQTSENVSDHHGARRERSMFEKGKLYTVRLRVDYDLDFQYMARLRDGNEHPVGDPVHLPGASTGEVDVVMFGEEIEELRERMAAGVRLGPPRPGGPPPATFTFVPASDNQNPIQTLQAARLAARDRGEVARVAVREADGLHRYRVLPDGSLYSETADGGYADAFAGLAPDLLDAAAGAGLNLRDVYMNPSTEGTFTEQVQAALAALDALPAPAPPPAWPAPAAAAAAEHTNPVGGSVAQGVTPAAGMPSPAIENTPFSRSARPEGVPDLSLDELRGQPLSAVDLGGAAAHVGWTGGDVLTVQVPGAPDQHVRVEVGEPGEGLNAVTVPRAGTAEEPHLLRIWGRVHPDLVSSVLVHDLSHVVQTATAAAAGMPQGVLRTSPQGEQTEGTDLCLLPRMDEHAHLSDKWHATTDPARRERLAAAIDAVAEDIRRRGHTPPAPPWGTGPRAPVAAEPQSRIARLLSGGSATGLDTSPPGLGKLAEIAGVPAITPGAVTGATPHAGPADTFTVTAPGGEFTLTLAEAAPGATGVTVESSAPGHLTLRVPADAGSRAATAVAEHVAAHAATLAGDPATGRPAQNRPAEGGRPGPAEAAALARLRGLARAVAEAGPTRSRAERAALQEEARRLGLTGDHQGAPSRLAELSRSGDLTPAHVTAIRGHATLPETAAAGAVARAAALMGGRAVIHGPGLLDIVLPGRAPITVDVRRPGSGEPDPGALTYDVDPARTVGANERAAAGTAAAAVARALGLPPADSQELAELHEAVRQARVANTRQRPGRLGVLFDLVTEARPEILRLLPPQVATELATLADGRRPRDLPALLDRIRVLANATGWHRPEAECVCPDDGPCVCGLRLNDTPPVTPDPEAVAV